MHNTFVKHIMMITSPIKEFFTDSEWDLIYDFIGHALDDDEESEIAYAVRNKIHSIFDKE